jgi:uncharacterized protein with ATP-grasp and redox domains
VSKHINLSEKQSIKIRQLIDKESEKINPHKLTPPQFSEKIYQLFYEQSGNFDPYKSLRKQQNDFILERLEFFSTMIKNSNNPLKEAAFLSLAGNIIDFGSEESPDIESIFSQIKDRDLRINDFTEFTRRLKTSKSLLYLADNAGEAVFDRLFIEEIIRFNKNIKITIGVRSKPAINDILLEDARYIGLQNLGNLIQTGSSLAGTLLSSTTKEFKQIYHSSNLIISKGQGNFETLEAEPEDILYIFKIKCRIIAKYTHTPKGSLILGFSNSINRQGNNRVQD